MFNNPFKKNDTENTPKAGDIIREIIHEQTRMNEKLKSYGITKKLKSTINEKTIVENNKTFKKIVNIFKYDLDRFIKNPNRDMISNDNSIDITVLNSNQDSINYKILFDSFVHTGSQSYKYDFFNHFVQYVDVKLVLEFREWCNEQKITNLLIKDINKNVVKSDPNDNGRINAIVVEL